MVVQASTLLKSSATRCHSTSAADSGSTTPYSGGLDSGVGESGLEGLNRFLGSIQGVGIVSHFEDLVLADGVNRLLKGPLEFDDLVAESGLLDRLDRFLYEFRCGGLANCPFDAIVGPRLAIDAAIEQARKAAFRARRTLPPSPTSTTIRAESRQTPSAPESLLCVVCFTVLTVLRCRRS